MRTVLSHFPVLKSSTSGWQWRQVWEHALIYTRGNRCISLFSNTRGWETSTQISWNIFQKRFVLRCANRHLWLPDITLDRSRSVEELVHILWDAVQNHPTNWGGHIHGLCCAGLGVGQQPVQWPMASLVLSFWKYSPRPMARPQTQTQMPLDVTKADTHDGW